MLSYYYSRLMVGTPSENGKKWIPRWWHTCVQWEKLPTRTLSLPWEAFPFLDLRSEGLSNLASLDQTSFLLLYDRGKWKFFPRHEKFVLICILSLYTCMSPWRNYYSIGQAYQNSKYKFLAHKIFFGLTGSRSWKIRFTICKIHSFFKILFSSFAA